MNRELLEEKLSELPLYIYDFIDPAELEFFTPSRKALNFPTASVTSASTNAPGTAKAGPALPVWAVWTAARASARPTKTA